MLKSLVTVFLAVVLTSPAFAQAANKPMERRGPGHTMETCDMCEKGDMMGGMMGKCLEFAEKLGLSEEQIAKLKPIHREMKKKQIRFRADLELARIDMMEIMEVKDFNLEKATAQVKKIEDMKTQHHLEMLKSIKEVCSILNDEQFKKMKKMMMHMQRESKECNMPPKKMMKK